MCVELVIRLLCDTLVVLHENSLNDVIYIVRTFYSMELSD